MAFCKVGYTQTDTQLLENINHILQVNSYRLSCIGGGPINNRLSKSKIEKVVRFQRVEPWISLPVPKQSKISASRWSSVTSTKTTYNPSAYVIRKNMVPLR